MVEYWLNYELFSMHSIYFKKHQQLLLIFIVYTIVPHLSSCLGGRGPPPPSGPRSPGSLSSWSGCPCLQYQYQYYCCVVVHRFHNRLYNHGEGPWLKAPNSAFTFNSLLPVSRYIDTTFADKGSHQKKNYNQNDRTHIHLSSDY